jgi:hypothetical protein
MFQAEALQATLLLVLLVLPPLLLEPWLALPPALLLALQRVLLEARPVLRSWCRLQPQKQKTPLKQRYCSPLPLPVVVTGFHRDGPTSPAESHWQPSGSLISGLALKLHGGCRTEVAKVPTQAPEPLPWCCVPMLQPRFDLCRFLQQPLLRQVL